MGQAKKEDAKHFSEGFIGRGFCELLRLHRLVSKGQISCIHFDTSAIQLRKARFIYKLYRDCIPIIITHHGSRPVDLSELHGCIFTAVSPTARDAMVVPAGAKIHIIPNGVSRVIDDCDTSGVLRDVIEDPRIPIVWVGRTGGPDVVEKDPLGFLLLAHEDFDQIYQFVLVDGEGTLETAGVDTWLRDRIKYKPKMSQSGVRNLLGIVSKKKGALVMTSRSEGFPVVVVEAFSMHCPVVVPDVNGLQCVVHKVNGFKYDRHDGLDGLKDAIGYISDREVVESVCSYAYDQAITTYSLHKTIQQYQLLYGKELPQRYILKYHWLDAIQTYLSR
jgi:glycosyltransferase involved in cell wall biosynthesis